MEKTDVLLFTSKRPNNDHALHTDEADFASFSSCLVLSVYLSCVCNSKNEKTSSHPWSII
jgi:hypothetical protein